MYFRAKVMVNRFLNWLSPSRKARRRAELRKMCDELLDVLAKLEAALPDK